MTYAPAREKQTTFVAIGALRGGGGQKLSQEKVMHHFLKKNNLSIYKFIIPIALLKKFLS